MIVCIGFVVVAAVVVVVGRRLATSAAVDRRLATVAAVVVVVVVVVSPLRAWKEFLDTKSPSVALRGVGRGRAAAFAGVKPSWTKEMAIRCGGSSSTLLTVPVIGLCGHARDACPTFLQIQHFRKSLATSG